MTAASEGNATIAPGHDMAAMVDVSAVRIALIGYGEVGGIFGAAAQGINPS